MPNSRDNLKWQSNTANQVPMRKSIAVMTLVFTVFVIYIGTLILQNYLLQLNLHQKMEENFVREAETKAERAAFFIRQAKEKLESFGSNRKVHVLLQEADSDEKAELLSSLAGMNPGGEMAHFYRLALLDKEGRLLVDVSSNDEETVLSDESWEYFIEHDYPRSKVFFKSDLTGNNPLVLSLALVENDAYRGQIVGWLAWQLLLKELSALSTHPGSFSYMTSKSRFACMSGDEDVVREAQKQVQEIIGVPHQFTVKFADSTIRRFVTVKSIVPGTSLAIIQGVPAAEVYGSTAPWELPVAMGVLAVVILGGMWLILKSGVETLVLGAHLEEASAQRQWLEEKNCQLEEEIAGRRLLSTAVEQAAEPIVITRTDGTIEYVNPAFETVTGYSPEEVMGRNPNILQSGQLDTNFYRCMWDRLEQGKVWEGHFTNRRKNGELYEEDATISPVRDANGSITNYVAVKRDVTAHMNLEQQLRQSQKMEALGELAGGVAHDFNNILTVILGNCNLLLSDKSCFNDGSIENIEEINSAGERAASLTQQLLAFSRQRQVKLELLNVSDLICNSEKMLKRLIRENISLRTFLPPEPILIKADPVQIDQVIINLVVNARDAMPDGGELTMTLHRTTIHKEDLAQFLDSGSYAVLEVADTGVGMDEETQRRIFEPFFTTKEEQRGTGLGLATVYAVVQQNGGHVAVESRTGEGTVFRIFFPLVTEEEILLNPESQNENSAINVELTHKATGEKIMVVDDEESVLNLVRRVLEKDGYTVFAALDCDDILTHWQHAKDDIRLLVTDVVMPGMSGIEVAQKLRQDRPDLHVIFMSAYTDSAVMDDFVGEEKGGHFLQKPFAPRVLLQHVREILAN